MALATLSIDLEARLARFEGDLGRASRMLDKLASDAGTSLGRVGEVFAGSALAAGAVEAIRSIANFVPTLIEGVAALQDLSEQTGATVEGLLRMQTAADVSGVSIDTMAGLMVRLTGNLGKITTETRGAGQALANLGIEAEAFRRLSPDEQIARLSAAFNSFEDGKNKTSNAIALFGTRGAAVLKFFKEYGDGLESSSRLTAQMVQQADAWADANAKSASQLKQLAQVIAVQALPAMTALRDGVVQGTTELLGLKGVASDPQFARAFLDFAEPAAVAVGTLAEALLGVGKTVRAVAGSVQAVIADMGVVFTVARASPSELRDWIWSDTGPVAKAIQERHATVKEANDRYVDLWTYNGTALTDAIRRNFTAQRNALDAENQREAKRMAERNNTLRGSLPTLKPVTLPELATSETSEQVFTRLMAQLRERATLAQAEIDTGQKLAESDRVLIDLTKQLAAADSKLTDEQKRAAEAEGRRVAAVLRRLEAQAEAVRLTQAETRAYTQAAQQQDDRNRQLADELTAIGQTAEAVDALRAARLAATIAQRDEATAALEAMGLAGTELDQRNLLTDAMRRELELRQQLAARREDLATIPLQGASQAVQAYFEQVRKAGDATRSATASAMQGLEDSLASSLASGKLDITQWVASVITEIYRLQVVRPLLQSIFAGSGTAGAFASLFGGAAGGSASSGGYTGSLRGSLPSPSFAGTTSVAPAMSALTAGYRKSAPATSAGGSGAAVQPVAQTVNVIIQGGDTAKVRAEVAAALAATRTKQARATL